MESFLNRVKGFLRRKANKKPPADSQQDPRGSERKLGRPSNPAVKEESTQQPLQAQKAATATTMASGTFTIQLQNQTGTSPVYGYISE